MRASAIALARMPQMHWHASCTPWGRKSDKKLKFGHFVSIGLLKTLDMFDHSVLQSSASGGING